MSLKVLFLLLGVAALLGAVIGYVFRLLSVGARRNSIEVEVKRMLLDAREHAEKITAEAEATAREKLATAEASLQEKEEKITRAEDRVFKREEALDKKQNDLDTEIGVVKSKIDEIKSIKERADALLGERAEALAQVAGLSKDQAKEATLGRG